MDQKKATTLIIDQNISLSETEADKRLISPDFFEELKQLLNEIPEDQKLKIDMRCYIESNTEHEIDKMLTLSTAHISETTSELLEKDVLDGYFKNISCYKKGDLGFFVYLLNPDEPLDQTIPSDLYACMQYADDLGCTVLCFDRDGDIMSDLKTYEWWDHE